MGRITQHYLMVTDIEASSSFYEEVIGLDETERTSTKATLAGGGCELVLEEDFDEAVLADFGLSPPGDDRGRGTILVVEVDDIPAVSERATQHGATVLTGPREVDWGRRLMLIKDPDGYVVEVSKPL